MTDQDIYTPPIDDFQNTIESKGIDGIDTNLASRWARLGASLMDGLIIALPFGVLLYGTEYWDRAISQEITLLERALSFTIGIAVYFLLNGYLLARRGQTIGKWVLGIKIVSSKTNELLPVWKILSFRYLPKTVIGSVPIVGQYLYAIEVLFIFRKDKKCVHDFIAGTKVINE